MTEGRYFVDSAPVLEKVGHNDPDLAGLVKMAI